MANDRISVSWHLYNDAVQSGFSLFQQNGDFVDLTLAADGHFVRVHRLVVGISSPYLKMLIESAPCEKPIIFLNNVSYATLCSLLEYVYTGEVAVPEENLRAFLATAKELQIRGLDDAICESNATNEDETVHNKVLEEQFSFEKRMSTVTQVSPTKSSNNPIMSTISLDPEKPNDAIDEEATISMEPNEESNISKDSLVIGNSSEKFELAPMTNITAETYANSQELQYTVSSRGSLQLILNRYMYNLFSKSNRGQIRRWRCIDYRDHKCPACCVTNGNIVVRRTNMHIHPFHDKKIFAKIQKKAIYSAIKSTKITEDDVME